MPVISSKGLKKGTPEWAAYAKEYARQRYEERRDELLAKQKQRDSSRAGEKSAYNKAYYAENKLRLCEAQKVRDEGRRDANAARSKAWRDAHPERVVALQRSWYASNAHVSKAHAASRRAKKLQATPKWADNDAISDVYLEAQYHQLEVDHIIPLQGKTVCGLHVAENLQLLSRAENRSKGNRYASR